MINLLLNNDRLCSNEREKSYIVLLKQELLSGKAQVFSKGNEETHLRYYFAPGTLNIDHPKAIHIPFEL